MLKRFWGKHGGSIVFVITVLVGLWVVSTVYSNLETEEEMMDGYRQDCIQRYNITDTGLINKCAIGTSLMDTMESTGSIGSMDLFGMLLVIIAALVILGIIGSGII